MVKRLGIPRTVEFCLSQKPTAVWNRNNIDRTRLLKFTNAVEPFLTSELQIRVEGKNFNIYCKDRILLNRLSNTLSEWATELHEPANDIEQDFLNGNTKKVLCNYIPFKTYQYKVYIKSTAPLGIRDSFKSWVANYNGKIKVPKHTAKWFEKGSGWGWIPTIYVKDSATLSMVGLFLGSTVQKVEEFIPRSSINSTINQEQICQL
jgi:hypothetical protein